MLVVTRLRTPSTPSGADPAAEAELREGLLRALAILEAKPGFVTGGVGRNVDDPALWVLTTRWENVGSYRRALGSYEGKMHIQPLMVHALDEPSAYEVVEEGTDLNEAIPRRRPEEGEGRARLDGSIG
ncbi:antibiotic biosynthesis monooxygenase family protein [Nocardioides hwasunensis]|uniref:Antibiotic biosynthesis monooxygenase n=1 Tax=Nocardioides hwasunensis TaxID=397258 RepID=A0ABR8MPY8_9ACTN|nr:antibiotic biosynthesis monooxygenase family protein [Nocardioides hwasunensis]MBD3916159.1 antibiotic biosynthesis monooxygenase [Nocardioides hwasunensis]